MKNRVTHLPLFQYSKFRNSEISVVLHSIVPNVDRHSPFLLQKPLNLWTPMAGSSFKKMQYLNSPIFFSKTYQENLI